MAEIVVDGVPSRHRVIRETRPRMAKAMLPKGENALYLVHIGGCLDEARRVVGWTVSQLADELDRDEKQVARWIRGEERTQVDVVFTVAVLQAPFVVAMARLAQCEIETWIKVKTT